MLNGSSTAPTSRCRAPARSVKSSGRRARISVWTHHCEAEQGLTIRWPASKPLPVKSHVCDAVDFLQSTSPLTAGSCCYGFDTNNCTTDLVTLPKTVLKDSVAVNTLSCNVKCLYTQHCAHIYTFIHKSMSLFQSHMQRTHSSAVTLYQQQTAVSRDKYINLWKHVQSSSNVKHAGKTWSRQGSLHRHGRTAQQHKVESPPGSFSPGFLYWYLQVCGLLWSTGRPASDRQQETD